MSILPAVSKAPDTVIALESTAQGMTGIGETFYEYWEAANKTGRAWNGFTPIFLSWLDDPACVRPDWEAEDAPASDFEKDLMKKLSRNPESNCVDENGVRRGMQGFRITLLTKNIQWTLIGRSFQLEIPPSPQKN